MGTPTKPSGGVGSNQYQTRGGGMVLSPGTRAGVAAALVEGEQARCLVEIPERTRGVVVRDGDRLVVRIKCGDTVHEHVHENGRWRAQQSCDEWSGCGTVRRAARNIGKKYSPETAAFMAALGIDLVPTAEKLLRYGTAEEAWQWIAAGKGHEFYSWPTKGFSLEDMSEWEAAGVRMPSDAVRWRDAGFSPEQARPWAALRIDKMAYDDLRRAGIATVEEADEFLRRSGLADASSANLSDIHLGSWLGSEMDPDEIRLWRDAGVSPEDAVHWREGGYTPDQAEEWVRHHLRHKVAAPWLEQRLTYDDWSTWRAWVTPHLTPKDQKPNGPGDPVSTKALGWAKSKVADPDEAERWWNVGVHQPHHADTWIKHGYTPERVAELAANGDRDVDVACGGETHRVSVRWRNGKATYSTPNHDMEVERIAASFGGTACECVRVRTEAVKKRKAFVSPGEALAWTAGSPPGRDGDLEARRWLTNGFPLYDLAAAEMRRREAEGT